jgi:hypothetical protein
MGARQSLNGVSFAGCCAAAGLAGAAAESWWVFLIALAVAAGWAVFNGDIRPGRIRR